MHSVAWFLLATEAGREVEGYGMIAQSIRVSVEVPVILTVSTGSLWIWILIAQQTSHKYFYSTKMY